MTTNTEELKKHTPWVCFHCDEAFHDREKAIEHFGRWQTHQPACQIDIAEYRRMEALDEAWRNESSEIQVSMQAMLSKHLHEKRRAEEDGYDKGIQDMKKLYEPLLAAAELAHERLIASGGDSVSINALEKAIKGVKS